MADIDGDPACDVTGLCEVDDEDEGQREAMCIHCGGWRVQHPETLRWVPEHYLTRGRNPEQRSL